MTSGFEIPTPNQIWQLLVLLVVGTIGGFCARFVGLPLPFLIGALLACLPVVAIYISRDISIYFPQTVRRAFVGVVGALIGATVTPALLETAQVAWVSMVGILFFVPTVHVAGYWAARKIGKYDKVTALFAAMPGGFVEAVEVGTARGGNTTILVTSHFLRVLVVVIALPVGFFLWHGSAVGSSAGETLSSGDWRPIDPVQIVALALIGLILGRLFRLPAHHLMGPLLLSALLHGGGVVETTSPLWLLYFAQLIIGVGLATQFSRTNRDELARIFLAVSVQLLATAAIGAVFVVICAKFAGLPIAAMILSFSPGGVTEMGLIALSLSIGPVLVTAHHVLRIFLAVWIAGFLGARLVDSDPDSEKP